MNTTADMESNTIEPVMRAFRQLSPGSRGAVAAAELHEEHARFAPLNGGNLLEAGGQGVAASGRS